jgi:poly(ADP-ribose) glycohydrolase
MNEAPKIISLETCAGLRALAAAEPQLPLRERILPAIARHAAAAATRAPLAPHVAGAAATTIVSREDAVGWVARVLVGDLPHARGFPHADAAPLLAATAPQELAKLRAILAYFERVAEAPPRGVLSIERVVVAPHDWLADRSPLQPFAVDASGAIEDADDHRQVDFANAFLGGGVLSGGCVQEEIRFAVAPELLVAMIVSPRMTDREAIVMRGAERFAATTGYAFDLRYAGAFVDRCARDADGTPAIELVAIDALDYRRVDAGAQHGEPAIRRELDKARAGFARDARALPIATGNWGCGVFGGDPVQKAVVQWLAASAEGRALRYSTFGDARLGDLAGFVARASRLSVGELARRLFATGGRSYAALLA